MRRSKHQTTDLGNLQDQIRKSLLNRECGIAPYLFESPIWQWFLSDNTSLNVLLDVDLQTKKKYDKFVSSFPLQYRKDKAVTMMARILLVQKWANLDDLIESENAIYTPDHHVIVQAMKDSSDGQGLFKLKEKYLKRLSSKQR